MMEEYAKRYKKICIENNSIDGKLFDEFGVKTARYYAAVEGDSRIYIIGSYLADTAGKGLYDFVETETLPPVSYTHLDVYKRQVLPWSSGVKNPAFLGFSSKYVNKMCIRDRA